MITRSRKTEQTGHVLDTEIVAGVFLQLQKTTLNVVLKCIRHSKSLLL